MKSQKLDGQHTSQLSQSDFSQNADEVQSNTHTNNVVFGVLVIITQIAVGLLLGFFANVPAVNPQSGNMYVGSIMPLFLCFGMLMLVIIGIEFNLIEGFSLIFAYVRRLVFSSIGFNLLITCLSIQWYFIFNAFWSKVGPGVESTWNSTPNIGTTTFNIYLTNMGASATTVGSLQTNGATLTQAIQCALANVIAFSAILGKAGPLQAWFVSFFGSFGYELNRKLIRLMGIDYGGSYGIFVFGGFFGLFLGILLNCKYKGQNSTRKNRNYYGSIFSVALSLMGNLIVWCLFPILVMDPEFDSRFGSTYQLYTVPILIVFGMAASTLGSLSMSLILNHRINVRDIVQAPTAGAVATASASYFITNPVYGLVIGCIAGIFQALWQNFIEKQTSKSGEIVNTFSFFLFGIQGIIGSCFASGFRELLYTETNNLTINLTNLPYPVFSFIIAAISAGIGIVFGIAIGLLMMCSAKHSQQDHFHDYTYWVNDDGLHYDIVKPEKEESQQFEEEEVVGIYVKESAKPIKNPYAYL